VDDPYTVELDRAIELIEEKRITDQNKSIAVFPGPEGEIQLLNGRFGAYIAYNKQNYRIPKDKIAKNLTLEECLEIIKNTAVKPARKKGK
jgi:DNA topoisomerase-1